MLDEPRQQEVHRRDFATFLRRLGRDGSDGLQVIVATSEEDGSLTAMLGDTPHTMISLSAGSKVIRPCADSITRATVAHCGSSSPKLFSSDLLTGHLNKCSGLDAVRGLSLRHCRTRIMQPISQMVGVDSKGTTSWV